jgi:hypothetical protein
MINEQLEEDIFESVNPREASEFVQAMVELADTDDKELRQILLQKYGVIPAQLTDKEQEQCKNL